MLRLAQGQTKARPERGDLRTGPRYGTNMSIRIRPCSSEVQMNSQETASTQNCIYVHAGYHQCYFWEEAKHLRPPARGCRSGLYALKTGELLMVRRD